MPTPRVVITGMGIVAPNACGLEAFTAALRDMKSGVRYIDNLERLGFACRVGGIPSDAEEQAELIFSDRQVRDMNQNMRFASVAAVEAFRDAGLLNGCSALPPQDNLFTDTGAIIGTCVGGPDTFAERIYPMVEAGQVRRLGTTAIQRIMNSGISSTIAGLFGLGGHVFSNSCACCTGTEAIILGTECIRTGRAKRMIVGATESSSPYTWAGFDSMRLLCRKYNDNPDRASRPMSASAAGLVPACGAGILVLEDEAQARRRAARIYAEIAGFSANCGGQRNGGTDDGSQPPAGAKMHPERPRRRSG